MPETRYPYGYSTATKTLAELRAILAPHYHPEFLRRLLVWLESRGGAIGIGGHWRAGGAQPDKPGFAPEGKSFHQDQEYNDGVIAACAVDLVHVNPGKIHRAPTWTEVPAQGSPEAYRWGVHCNVGTPGAYGSESWHMQPVEIDGWQRWWDTGRPAPVAGYPIPGAPNPEPPEVIEPPGDDMNVTTPERLLDTRGGNDAYKLAADATATVVVPGGKGQRVAQVTVTVTQPDTAGFLTAWSAGAKPNTSFLNYLSGDTVTETLLVPLDSNGAFKVWSLARTHLIVDSTGVTFT